MIVQQIGVSAFLTAWRMTKPIIIRVVLTSCVYGQYTPSIPRVFL